jgi:ethanolamine permease
MSEPAAASPQLDRTLGPIMLWGLGVGYVISGMYFGWNLGLPEGGTLGMAVATGVITLMYLTFTFCYTELACAIPKAGGAFDYAIRALGKDWGFLAGMAQNIEFLFAPPAIAFAIGAYVHIFFPGIPPIATAGILFPFYRPEHFRGEGGCVVRTGRYHPGSGRAPGICGRHLAGI